MYVTKRFPTAVTVVALRSICNQVGHQMDQATAQAVGQLANQMFQEEHLDAIEGSIAAEYIQMIADHLDVYEDIVLFDNI